uniref:BHLH domain-containing protein n=1 Tax=Nelumbo nucifera TaxID=4432 RepID=A0A822YQP6_NELNU|nr:TPA_asm: hypothetical protein HUJ06_005477 [Nelumbo nucifera]
MSGRRSRASTLTQDEINDLVLQLRALLPEIRQRGTTGETITPNSHHLGTIKLLLDNLSVYVEQVTMLEILKEACNYIKRLHREVDGLSQRLSDLMASVNTNSPEADILRNLLMQE